MATVELRFSALPTHVRTARLIAAAVARRSDLDEAVVDEIKLAVGEACSRAVQVHRDRAPADDVVVRLTDDDGFVIQVCDRGPADEGDVLPKGQDSVAEAFHELAAGGANAADTSGQGLPPSFGLAMIAGLVDDLDVQSGPDGTVVRMRWPASAAAPAAD